MTRLNRRSFLAASALACAAPSAWSFGRTIPPPPQAPRAPVFKKAVKIGMVGEGGSLLAKLRLLRELGYDGVELDSPNKHDPSEVLEAKEASGIEIHGVVDSVHWSKPLSHPDGSIRDEGLQGLLTAIRDATTYGATTVLLVPAVVSKEVAYGDAYRRSQAMIRKALPLAEESGVSIAIENVWNNFLLSPLEMARYLDEFESPRVGAYFDVGNIVRYGWPVHWIAELGARILKIDVKGYSRKLQNERGPGAGFQVELDEGDCDWPEVARALRANGFNGWATAEVRGGNRERLADILARMNRALAPA